MVAVGLTDGEGFAAEPSAPGSEEAGAAGGATLVGGGKGAAAGSVAAGASSAGETADAGLSLADGSDPPREITTTTMAASMITPSAPETTATIARREELFHSACVTEAP